MGGDQYSLFCSKYPVPVFGKNMKLLDQVLENIAIFRGLKVFHQK